MLVGYLILARSLLVIISLSITDCCVDQKDFLYLFKCLSSPFLSLSLSDLYQYVFEGKAVLTLIK